MDVKVAGRAKSLAVVSVGLGLLFKVICCITTLLHIKKSFDMLYIYTSLQSEQKSVVRALSATPCAHAAYIIPPLPCVDFTDTEWQHSSSLQAINIIYIK